jgi:redox-sensitive bicupin YhaK (pirin superfamily)
MTNTERQSAPSDSHDGKPCPGHPVLERIETRGAEVGLLPIHRALPSRQRRMVGAWCFLDHAGPIDYAAGQGLRVGPHPHIGLQTFTWMIEGEIMHRDSLGYEQVIRPGQVNLMTAGRGIAHAEDEVSATAPGRLHAVQLWIALPEAERHRAPSFRHYPDLPVIREGGFRATVLAGSAFGRTAPAEVFSPLVGLDLAADGAASLTLPLEPGFEYAVLGLIGETRVEGEALPPDTLLYLGLGRRELKLQCGAASRLVLIGGEPFGEEILLWWNFVARRPQEMEEATLAWNEHRHFGEVKGSPSPRLVAPDIAGLHLRTARP